jgi:sec-independent protein translocase protein TatB
MMNRMSFSETIFLFFLALIIFGPKKLPDIARKVGKAMNEFKRASNEFKAQIEQEISSLEVDQHQTILPPSPAPEGTTSRTLYAAPSETIGETIAPEGRVAQADSEDEPLFAAAGSPATSSPDTVSPSTIEPPPVTIGAHNSSDDVASPTSQESHA